MRVLANIEDMGFPVQASALVTTDRFTKNDDLTRRDVRSIIESFHVIKTNPAPTSDPKIPALEKLPTPCLLIFKTVGLRGRNTEYHFDLHSNFVLMFSARLSLDDCHAAIRPGQLPVTIIECCYQFESILKSHKTSWPASKLLYKGWRYRA